MPRRFHHALGASTFGTTWLSECFNLLRWSEGGSTVEAALFSEEVGVTLKKKLFIIFSVLLSILLIVLLIIYFVQRTRPQPGPAILPSSICTSHSPTYSVAGKYILDSRGHTFIPYGVQLEGILFAQTNWRTDGALMHLTFKQLLAAHNFWHSNTVSLQISSKNLFDQSPYDKNYLSVIDQTVHWAKQLDLNILLVLQYEGHGNSNQAMPTQDTLHFWDVLSRHYANNPGVFFDIFNEPRPADLFNHSDSDKVWDFWQNGGNIKGATYIGFQQVVNTIRGNGAQNLIFVDGLAAGEDIHLLPRHALRGCNIVYAIHPYLNASQHRTPEQWDGWFGDATRAGDFPVVADEWSEYQGNNGECIVDAPSVVPQFLSYLRGLRIGLIGYALFPGTLIRGWNFQSPTAFDKPSYSCPRAPLVNLDPAIQGAGQLLRQYFAEYSIQLPQTQQ